jgi:hypothetical protein
VLAGAGAGGAGAQTSAPGATVVVRDARDAHVQGAPDVIRASLGRGPDGRLRAAISLVADLTVADMRSDEGPPGSVCLRVWTVSAPPNMAADFLVCVTAKSARTLRGTVLREDLDGQPDRVAEATVRRRGDRVLVVSFSQSAIGRPARLRFAVEATKAGCPRQSCVDVAPDAPRTTLLRLR